MKPGCPSSRVQIDGNAERTRWVSGSHAGTSSSFVLDMPGKRIYGDGWLEQPPRGTTTHVNRGRTTTTQGEIPFREEIIVWASEQLRNAPLSGSRKATLKMLNTNGTGIPFVATRGEGGAEVEMSWRFQ